MTLSLPIIKKEENEFQVRLQRCGLLIWQGVVIINTFSNSRLHANCDSAIRMDPTTVSNSFKFEFALKHFVISENFLTNLVVKIDMDFVGMK